MENTAGPSFPHTQTLNEHVRQEVDITAASSAGTADLTTTTTTTLAISTDNTDFSLLVATPKQSENIATKTATTTAAHALSAPIFFGLVRSTLTAAFRVLNMPELLEHILLQDLSTAEVTRARQVNQYFQAVIDNSKLLRRVMFLEPEPVRETLISEDAVSYSIVGDVYKQELRPMIVTKLHPAISLADAPHDKFSPDHFRAPSPSGCWLPGMWRSMLLCQPPCAEIMTIYNVHRIDEAGWRQLDRIKFCSLKGTTLGDMVDQVDFLGVEYDHVELTGLSFDGHVDERSSTVREARLKRERYIAKAARVAAEKAEAEKAKEDADQTQQAQDAGEAEFLVHFEETRGRRIGQEVSMQAAF